MSVIENGISSETEVPVIYGLNNIDRAANQDLKGKIQEIMDLQSITSTTASSEKEKRPDYGNRISFAQEVGILAEIMIGL